MLLFKYVGVFFQYDLLSKAKARSWKVVRCFQISGFHRMVSKACSCQHRRLNDTAFLSVLGISKQDEIFAHSTFFLAIFESLLVCVYRLKLFVHVNYQKRS